MKYFAYFLSLMCFVSCQTAPKETLTPITVKDFRLFVEATDYKTDAEKYGWSIVQKNVFEYDVKEGVDWRNPDGINIPKDDFPVTQVSYNDAMAYCKWSNTRLPTYDEYWAIVATDNRKIIEETTSIFPIQDVNIVGNVWDLTHSDDGKNVRLAGGSLFCSPVTCNGKSPDRTLYVDNETGNIHIGFSVIK